MGRVLRALHGKIFPGIYYAKAQEFLEIKQGTMLVLEYVARFTELAHFFEDHVAINMTKVRIFKDGLKFPICGKIIGFLL